MSNEVTRSKVIVVWFLFLALVVATVLMFGVSFTTETAALLAALCLVPPGLLLMLWPGVQPQTAVDSPTAGQIFALQGLAQMRKWQFGLRINF